MQTTDWILHLERLSGSWVALPTEPPDPTLLAGNRGEQVLWRAACRETPAGESPLGADVEALLARDPSGGPLLAADAFLAIEVWAECELAALHALHRLIRQAPRAVRADPRARLERAARWHLEHTQPDNSTNRPWALHVFLSLDDPTGEAGLYAQTLLHNTLASHARDEPLSRWILADAARELRLARD
jgi:hypothetical protein